MVLIGLADAQVVFIDFVAEIAVGHTGQPHIRGFYFGVVEIEALDIHFFLNLDFAHDESPRSVVIKTGIIRTASNIDKTADHFSEDILLAMAVRTP